MKSWLKGGLIGGGIGVVAIGFLLFMALFSQRNYPGPPEPALFLDVANLLFVPIYIVPGILLCGYESNEGALSNGICNSPLFQSFLSLGIPFFVYLSLFFVIGAIIGLIVGKIRNRKIAERFGNN